MDQFSTSLNPNHIYQAIFLQKEIAGNKDLTTAGYKAPDINVHTTDAFKKAFTFPQIALNDYASTALENLRDQETALNKALSVSNKDGVENFIQLAKATSQNLKSRYGDQWINPNSELLKDEKTDTSEATLETIEKPAVVK
jgi:hypothetical protein